MDALVTYEELAQVGLVYTSDEQPGIVRRQRGRGYSYLMPDGTSVDNPTERARIKSLGIPPAYQDVWICPLTNGHLQYTGRDDRKRKQYRYHADWSTWRARQKFADLIPFGHALPRIRRRLGEDLREGAGSKRFALAAVVSLIDATSVRVGSEAYAREYGSYGATTLRNKHVRVDEGVVRLNYRAKGGVRVRQTLRDKRLHRVLDEIHDLPGRRLFTYVGDDGAVHGLDSSQVNEYLQDISGCSAVTAKTFRTWAGTLAAYVAATTSDRPTIKTLSQAAAQRLHNTPTICRNSYIHPAVLALARKPEPALPLAEVPKGRGPALLRFLEEHGDLAEHPDAGSAPPPQGVTTRGSASTA